jgi:hypothetical protein
MAVQEYELFAIRYATHDAQRSEHFIGGDPHDGPMPMDYFMWLPGHDPLVMKFYPAPSPQLEGIAVRLDVPPSGAAPARADPFSQR